MAAKLDFQAIVDLVGDKLREVLRSSDIQIVLWNPTSATAHVLYALERGVRIQVPPHRPNVDGAMFKALQANRPVVANNRSEMTAWGLRTVDGTRPSLATAIVPIFAVDRYIGAIVLEDHERENAFGESEVRLVGTIAASMGVALENARLFDETQRLLKETEARNAELAVINSIQQGMAEEMTSRPSSTPSATSCARCSPRRPRHLRGTTPSSRQLRIASYLFERGERYHRRAVRSALASCCAPHVRTTARRCSSTPAWPKRSR